MRPRKGNEEAGTGCVAWHRFEIERKTPEKTRAQVVPSILDGLIPPVATLPCHAAPAAREWGTGGVLTVLSLVLAGLDGSGLLHREHTNNSAALFISRSTELSRTRQTAVVRSSRHGQQAR